ncbi:MAG: hypothetical protein IBJ14_04935 [Hydrogenophaga sp.]|nr:hypothetical protein [Hydrogenophaga sp.]
MREAALVAAQQGVQPPTPGQYWPDQSAWYAGPVAYADGRVFALLLPDGFDQLGLRAWSGKYGNTKATNLHDGLANTQAMAASGSKLGKDILALEGELYLPSRIEALQLFATLKEQIGGGWAWTSTQYSEDGAWLQNFGSGGQGSHVKKFEGRVRLVRRLLLQSFNASGEVAA